MSIPKIIHQLWISPNGKPPPADIIKNTQSWEHTHPDFIRVTWSLSRLENLLKNFHGLNVLGYIHQCAFPAMQSDVIRLALIYEYGGFWSDLKNLSLKPFLHELINEESPILSEHWPVTKPPVFKPHLSNSFLGAPNNNKFIWNCLEIVCQNIEEREVEGVYSITGGGAMMKCLSRKLLADPNYQYHLLAQENLWNNNIKRSGGSYNDGNKHWSIREKSESCFVK